MNNTNVQIQKEYLLSKSKPKHPAAFENPPKLQSLIGQKEFL